MTNAQRERLEYMLASQADSWMLSNKDREAIRAALDETETQTLELGAQRSRVIGLVSRITGKPGDLTNEAVGAAMREAGRLREEVARLRSLLLWTIGNVRQITRGQDAVTRELDAAINSLDAPGIGEAHWMRARLADALHLIEMIRDNARDAIADGIEPAFTAETMRRTAAFLEKKP